MSRENVDDIIHRMEAVRNNIEGNAEILSWLRGEQAIYDENEKRRRNITVIDFDDVKRNVFQVTDEGQYTNGMETNRTDIMFLINGIPVAIVETKSAKKTNGMEEALIIMDTKAEFAIMFPELGVGLQAIAPGIVSHDSFGCVNGNGPFFQNDVSLPIRYV